MSIQSEIERISTNISAAYDVVADMGGEIPGKRNSANLAAAIRSITVVGSAIIGTNKIGKER